MIQLGDEHVISCDQHVISMWDAISSLSVEIESKAGMTFTYVHPQYSDFKSTTPDRTRHAISVR